MPDYSCYCWVDANRTKGLTVLGKDAGHGRFRQDPSGIDGSRHDFSWWVMDYPGPYGTEGFVTFRTTDGGELIFSFVCPTGNRDNLAGFVSTGIGAEHYICEVNRYGAWADINKMPPSPPPPRHTGDAAKRWHPLFVVYKVIDKRLPSS